MTQINWKSAQSKLGVIADGIPGRNTYTALFAFLGPKANETILASLGNAANVWFLKYYVTLSAERMADFLAQTANETGGYVRFEENPNYSVANMLKYWPTHFTAEQAAAAVGKPVEILSRAYGGRMGNDPYPSTDGWDYRGSGMLQLTGKANWLASEKSLGIGLDTNPELARIPALSLLIALDFYSRNKVWGALDAGNPTQARKITNGGTIGLDNVNALRAKFLEY